MNEENWIERRSWPALRQSGEEIVVAGAADRVRVATLLDLESLDSLSARLAFEPWFDGARISGRVEASAMRLCGITLEPLEERVETDFEVRVVPEGSPRAPIPEAELIVALDAEDPPEVVQGGAVDIAAHVVEALSLALDPFPRNPQAVFDYVDARPVSSPFAVLQLKRASE